MSSLPEELCLDILLRLPAKSTLVCKSVCKNWYALISDHDFVKKHHNLTIEKTNFRLMISGYDTKRSCNVICSLSYDPLSLTSDEFHLYGVEIERPVCIHCWRLMGSCNGFLCIWSLQKDCFCLWDPDSKECKELPKSPIKTEYRQYRNAFGYDYSTGDYKLVCLYGQFNGYLVEVFTTGLNSWRKTQVIPYYMPEESGVLINGVFHWLGRRRDSLDQVIISLDISSEIFKELRPPKELLQNVGELKKCLCVLAYAFVNVEIWVMQDYGVQESWTRHYNITNEIIMRQPYNLKFVWSFNSGQILFLRHDSLISLIWYDPKDGSARDTNVHVSGSDEYNYLHSLPHDFQYLCGWNAS